MALEERNMVEDFKRVRWADLEDEEQGSRCEQMAEKEEIMNRSEALTETQAADGQEDRGEEKERQTENDDSETWQGCRQQHEDTRQAADDDDETWQGGQQQQEETRQAADDDDDETRQGDQQQKEDRGEHESDELIWTEEEYDPNRYVYLYATNLCPECQEPLFDGCDCVDVDWTADSERRKKEYEDGLKQKRRQEGKGRGETGIRKVWEDWWRVREAEWMNEEWEELSSDDLDMGENGVGLRQEQWEEVRRMSWRNERWSSPTEESDRSGFETLQKKVERLGRRVQELEGERKKGKDSRRVTESSSGSEEGGGKW